LSDLVIKQNTRGINQQRRNELTFKKQAALQETHSSSERVVIIEEEDKESDFSQSTESLKPQAAVNVKP
jgi:hypothetical protein